MKKKFTLLIFAILASLGAMASPPQQDEGNVAKWNDTEYATLQEALDAAEAANPKTIVIDLLTDAELDVSARNSPRSIGTTDTESITINGGDNKLTINLLDSDWSDVSTANDSKTKLILNNLNLASGKYNSGHWKRNGIFFSCAVQMNNVNSSCGIGFKNDATLNNVTVNTTGSNYAVWVQSNGETVNIEGLTVNGGRGIKIADEDAGTESVSISVNYSTFNTTAKAAILASTKYGAEITIGSGNDISGVVADTENFVWVDEDWASYFNTINVTGATKTLEGSIAKIGDNFYASIADAVAAASAGDVIEIFKAGTYTLPEISKNVTIEGTVDGVEVSHTSAGSVASIPNGCTFKNITFNFGNVDYHGFQHAGTINMEGCTLNGKFFSYGDMNFTSCEFNQTNADYHMWAYSGNLVYTGCTFTNNATGKFLNVYNEDGSTKYTVTANNCKFVNNASSNKAALNVKVTCGNKSLQYDVYVNNCTTEGAFPEVSKSDALYVLNSVVQVDDRKAAVEDRITVTENGVLIYPSFVAQYNGTKYSTLQAALDAAEADDKPNISIDLLDDATLDINAWSGTGNSQAIGTTNTQSITINGNSHKLTFMTKNTDWNNIATMNDSQTKLVLNNMTIDQGGVNTKGTWNSYDINFNCAVELNNVTAKRALAFKNSATLKDVTVNQAGGSSDVYGIWISPRVENQTINIDGLKLTASAENGTGRGIKVDDQYVTNNGGTVYKVTLNIANSTFSTEAKAAILLKAAEGVDVIDGGGNIIENVAADNVNLVWVDESRAAEYYKYSLTSTSGATMVPEKKESDYVVRLSNPEGKIMGYYKGTDAIANAVAAATADGFTATIFQTGEYTMPNLPHNITIEAAEGVEGVVFNHTGTGNIASIPNGATFKGLTFNFGNNNYHGFQQAGTINMKGCTLNGKLFNYADMNFTECTFNQENEDYNMWVYAGGTVNYKDCTFTGKGKLLHLYTEDGNATHTVNVDGCTFSSSKNSKAAINVKATCGSTVLQYDLTITNSKTEGGNFPAATITQPLVVLNDLAQVDDRTATGVDNIRIWQDGVQIYPLAPVAKIGEIGYPTLQSALDAAHEMTGDVTVQLVADITEQAIVHQKAGLNLTIEGKEDDANHTIAGQIIIDGDNRSTGTETLTIKDIKFEGNANDFLYSKSFVIVPNMKSLPAPYYRNINNYAHNITISDCSFTSTSEDLDIVGFTSSSGGGNCYNLVMSGVTGTNLHSMAQLTSSPGATFENCSVENSKSFIGANTASGTYVVKDCKFVSSVADDGYAIRMKSNSSATLTLTDNDFTAFEAIRLGENNASSGNINVESGRYVGKVVDENTGTGKIVISGGHFSAPIYEDAYAEFIAGGLYGIKNLYPEDEAAPNGVASGIVKVTEVNGDVTFYPSLQAAVDAAGENATVTPLVDIDLEDGFVTITKPVVIDGNNHVITSAAAQAILLQSTTAGTVKIQNADITASAGHGIQVGDDNTANIAKLELYNVTLTTAKRGVRVYSEDTGFGISIANSTIQSTVADPKTTYTTGNDAMALSLGTSDGKGYDVTIDNTVLQGYSYLINSVTSGSNLNVTMNGGETYGRAAVNVWGSNNNITLDGVEVHGLNNQTGPTEAFSCIVENIGAQNNVYTIKDSEFIATLSDAAATTEGSSATEQMIDLRGSDSTVKILGSTTYECNYPERGGLVYDESAIENNKFYFDDTAKATFADAFDKAVIADEKEQPIDLYPVTYTSEVYYYWITDGVEDGVNTEFATPYLQGWLADGEFIRLKKNFELGSDITCALGDGTSYTILLGDYTITKGDYSVSLLPGVTVYTDKQTDIFSAATEGYSIYELTAETGYAYTCGNYVAKVNNDLFETFPEAATAAAGTKVITLLQDISDPYTMSVGETLRVEKAGKAFDDPAAPDNNYTVNSMIEGPVTIYSLKAAEQFAAITDGYYHIKNLGNEKYVNVKGRKTATVDATEADTRTAAGTVIKVKATNGQVEVLRSQAIDIPHYAERAMSYVPDVAKLLVEKLNATGSGEILGTTGFDAIMQKFNDSFDYHLYTEQAEGGVRIFGRTPSMKPVVEFYNEHKANVDAKLPQLESYINSAIAKVVDKVGKGSSLKESFKLHTIWERMDNNALTEPNDDATKLAFLQQVLASETNVWNFAYQTATFYMEKVEGSSVFDQIPAELRSYWNLAKQVRPGFKYYIVQKDGKMDFISEGNIDIKNNAARTIWALEPATEFDVEFNVTNKDGEGFATLYTDFGYQLPEGVTALKVTGIDADDIAQTEEIGNAVAAQTPVLLKAPTAGKQTLTIGNYGAAVSGNEIHGADYLIDLYTINEPALESLFQLLAEASETTAEKYDYLQRKNSGTVNNKYFFPMTDEDVTSGETPIRTLTTDEEGTPVFAKTFTGVKANEAFMVSETIDPIYLDIPTTPDAPATIDEAYYRIKNLGNNQYVNVQGRKTATVDATEETAKTLPGTIIKVKSTVGVLDILRSQAVDVPRYAQRAMTYVPELAELIVEKLQATGSGEILGTTGFDAIMQKFNDSFDYHLHVVYADEEGDKYRIYGQIPTMKPVVEFYNEHKANVDYKLKDLETAVNGAIEKLVNKMGMGSSLINSFSLETIWQRMGSQLTKPADEASKLTFLQEVLSNEKNVWDFAYQTVTFYMEKVEKSQYFDKLPDNVKSYWNRAKNVHPGFKYYIVQKDNKMDIISQGNIDIQNDDLRTMWTLEPVETMTVNVPEANSRIIGATFDESGKRTGFETGYYTTLYTDFAYQLPEGVVALKVTEIKDTYLGDEKLTYEKEGVTLGLGLLKTEVIGQEVPAQTPVLIMSKTADPFEITIRDDFGASADVSGNLLHGADYLIEQYEINTPALEGLFDMVKGKVSSELTDKYEHLIRKNSGTVNNKFFFSLNINDELATAYQKKTGNEMKTSPVLVLSKLSGKKLAFNESWDNIQPNSVFLFSEKKMPALFTLTGDVTGKVDNVMMPDGIIDVSDVTGQVNIVQERDKKEYNYDYEAADVIYVEGTDIEVSDVTGEVNIIQKRSKHPDLP